MHRIIRIKSTFTTILLLIAVVFAFSGNAFAQQKDFGPLTPAEALEYMKKTSDVFLLDVSLAEKFATKHFVGAVNIPHSELLSRINEIPADRPLLLNCRLGRTCVKTYPLIRELRPDIKTVLYIAGIPLFTEYNVWIRARK